MVKLVKLVWANLSQRTTACVGATWNAIREATKTKLSSSAWFWAWEAAEVPHRPAGERKPSERPEKVA